VSIIIIFIYIKRLFIYPINIGISERTESLPTYSTVEAVTLRRYFLFFIFNVVIVFLLGRSFLDSFMNIIAGAANIYDTLGIAIPRVSNYIYLLLHILLIITTVIIRVLPFLLTILCFLRAFIH
jgi:hypothetical protein